MKIKKPRIFTLITIILIILVIFFIYNNKEIKNPYQKQSTPYPIYDIHEHVGEDNLYKLTNGMKQNDISYTAIVASPRYTLTLKNPGFDDFEKNNDYLLEKSKTNHILVFCTIDTRDENSLQVLKDCIERGGTGLKLYSGHLSSFYKYLGPLDRQEMVPIYEYCEKNNIPITFHINPYNESIRTEMENILTKYPNLKLNCPHWCLSSINTARFEELYDKYPNLYTDMSFGSMFAQAGFERFSKNPDKYKKLIQKYQDRIMYGTDMVITDIKKQEFVTEMLGCYRKLLEQKEFECTVGESGSKFSIYGNFTGLNLPDTTLKKIYNENPKTFLGQES